MCFYNDDGYSDIWNETVQKARKEHHCSDCNDPILPGETYQRIGSLFDGRWSTLKVCRRCEYDRMRIFVIEQSAGCRWQESFCPIDQLWEELRERKMEQTPKDKVPEDFGFDWVKAYQTAA